MADKRFPAHFLYGKTVEITAGEEKHRSGILIALKSGFDIISDIVNGFDERHGKTWIGQFLLARCGPEARSEIVMLSGAMRLDGAVTAMVVGKDETLG